MIGACAAPARPRWCGAKLLDCARLAILEDVNPMRHAGPRSARRGAACGRWLFVLATGTFAAVSTAQWQSALQACVGAALVPQQRISACTDALKSERLSARERAAALDNRGVAWKETGELGRAIADYDSAIATDPRFANAYSNRGAALGSEGDLDAAMRDFDRAIELDPMLALAYENRGIALISHGDLDAAIKDLDEAIWLGRRNERNYVQRAAAWQAKGDLSKAIADLGEAIRLNPGREELFVSRGLLWDRQQDTTHSIADYDEAIRLNPLSAVAYNNRCNTWLTKQAYAQAAADCDEALKLDPQLATAHFNRGVLWVVATSYDRARDEFDQAIRLDPRLAPAYKSRGALSYARGQFEAAQADLSQANRLLPSNPYVAIWLYLAQARAGHPQEAVQDLAQNAPDASDSAWPEPVIGLYLGHGDPGSVYKAAQQGDARTQGGRQCEVAFYVGEWHLLHGDRAHAVRLFEDAGRNCPTSFSESGAARGELERISR
jgi:lipoprotein NlpI